MVSIDDQYSKSYMGPVKFKTADIRHLENR